MMIAMGDLDQKKVQKNPAAPPAAESVRSGGVKTTANMNTDRPATMCNSLS